MTSRLALGWMVCSWLVVVGTTACEGTTGSDGDNDTVLAVGGAGSCSGNKDKASCIGNTSCQWRCPQDWPTAEGGTCFCEGRTVTSSSTTSASAAAPGGGALPGDRVWVGMSQPDGEDEITIVSAEPGRVDANGCRKNGSDSCSNCVTSEGCKLSGCSWVVDAKNETSTCQARAVGSTSAGGLGSGL